MTSVPPPPPDSPARKAIIAIAIIVGAFLFLALGIWRDMYALLIDGFRLLVG